MEQSHNWMTNRFVQDFANVGINGLNLESQTVPNTEEELYESGIEQFDVDTLIDTNNSNGDSLQRLSEVDYNGKNGFEASVHAGNNDTKMSVGVKKEKNPVQHSKSFVAQTKNKFTAIESDSKLDSDLDNDFKTVKNSGLDTVTSTLDDDKMETEPVKQKKPSSNSAIYFMPDTTEDLQNFKKRDQKRRPKPKDGTSLSCAICGDRALGYNFDAITCESCKAFFRRNALKTKVFACSFEGNCKLDPHTRKFCSGCRLKKCFDIGMKKNWILSDDQLAKRRKKSRNCDEKYPMESDMHPSAGPHQPSPQSSEYTQVSPSYPVAHNTDMYSQTLTPLKGSGSSDGDITTNYLSDSTDNSMSSHGNQLFSISPSQVKIEPCPEDMPRPLPADIDEQIRALEKEYQSVFDSGYTELQAKKMAERPHTANELFNMTDIFIRRLIKFAKHIPEFKCLKQEDQIYLLKGGIMEIMVLRSAMGFDPSKLEWKIKQQENMKEHGLDPNIIKEQLGSGMYTNHMQFVTSLHQLTRSDSTIMTLLFVIEIFSPDRPSILSKEKVTLAQEKFTNWLRFYLESIMPISEAQDLYPKLIVKLMDVRQLGESSSKLASHLDITKLEPLLVEVFNLQK